MAATKRGRIYITNGIKNHQVHPDVEIPEGWWRGMAPYERGPRGPYKSRKPKNLI